MELILQDFSFQTVQLVASGRRPAPLLPQVVTPSGPYYFSSDEKILLSDQLLLRPGSTPSIQLREVEREDCNHGGMRARTVLKN